MCACCRKLNGHIKSEHFFLVVAVYCLVLVCVGPSFKDVTQIELSNQKLSVCCNMKIQNNLIIEIEHYVPNNNNKHNANNNKKTTIC